MAKTHQTAKKSTGGKAPREQLAIRAARRTNIDSAAERFVRSIRSCWVSETSDGLRYYCKAGNKVLPVDAADFEANFGALIKRWCELRPSRKMTLGIATLWGLLADDSDSPHVTPGGPSRSPNAEHEDESAWAIKQIIYFDGSLENRRGYYAAAEEGSADWCKIDFHTIELGDITINSTKVQMLLVKRAANSETIVTKRGIKFGGEPAHLRRDRLDDYCIRHPNRPFLLDQTGARSDADVPHDLYNLSVAVRWQDTSGGSKCVVLSLLNALWVLPATDDRINHRDTAENIYNRHGLQTFRSLHRAADFLNRNYSQYRLEKAIKVKKNDRPVYDLDFVANLRQGVFLVKLNGTDNVNHCVTVDANAGLIYDGNESNTLHLSAKALKLCLGTDSHLVDIEEVYELKQMPIGRRRKRKRSNAI